MQLLGVGIWDQGVQFAMEKEDWTAGFLYCVYVSELFVDDYREKGGPT